MVVPASPTLSATSSAGSTTATVIDSHPNPKSFVNLRKQLKYIAIGSLLTWYFQVYDHLQDSLSLGMSSVSAKLSAISVLLLFATVLIFTHILLLPVRGHLPNYLDWRNDRQLATAIPLLTACIILGWTTLLITLSPVGAPAPPSSSILTRLHQAAQYTGLSHLQARINNLPALNTDSATSFESIAKKLSLPSSASPSSLAFQNYFVQLSKRAEDWASQNIKTIGWTGALAGSIGAYLLVFGCVGLLGFLTPDNRQSKHKQF
ncbi:hypothetical protein BCV70DRAFT_201250 [Testicularia cyperi]|uniref:Uncharacterized protein n=1 Tax=Testicularia cyperi TaxID=1882483 RepID=A0A317XMG3_9BASI|nr:hypothetical protein BCV70DRAFT_201250 [Testicularia cyperi]